jgi:uncharacterized protein YceH (UPF0502 family)
VQFWKQSDLHLSQHNNMSVQIGQLQKKRMVKNLREQIVDWVDETDGGVIVSKGRVVNQERWDRYQKKLADEAEALKAISKQNNDPNVPDRTIVPSKVNEVEKKVVSLETKVNDMDNKLDAILKAINGKK